MRVRFYSTNIDGKSVRWDFSGIDELMDAYWDEDADIPANDDPIRHVYLDNTPIFVENVNDAPTFGYLVGLLGIDA